MFQEKKLACNLIQLPVTGVLLVRAGNLREQGIGANKMFSWHSMLPVLKRKSHSLVSAISPAGILLEQVVRDYLQTLNQTSKPEIRSLNLSQD